jgi:prophage DNA circulation protein
MSTSPTDLAAAAQALAASLLASAVDPADGIRLLAQLAIFQPNQVTSSSVVGTSMATMQSACGDVFRRAAVVALCRAASTYQPSSTDDAANLRSTVTQLLDQEILVAGNQGEDNTFNALRALRAATVQDLQTRAAGLPGIMTVKTSGPLPAPVLAQRLYRDPTRADELVTESGAPHPAFLPPGFKALSS